MSLQINTSTINTVSTVSYVESEKKYQNELEADLPVLMLHFDVNRTITLEDSSKKVGLKEMVTAVLAENTISKWDKEHGRMSFKDFVYTVQVPGDKHDSKLKLERQKAVWQFFNWIKEHDHPVKEDVLARRDKLMEKFTDPETKSEKFKVFSAFYALIEKLQKLQIPFVVLLRTFGDDLQKIAEEIGTDSGIKFTRKGEFKGKVLYLEGEKEGLDTPKKIFESIIKSKEHFAIHDDWDTWNKDGEHGRSAKLIPFDSKNNYNGILNLTLCADDNTTGEERDIVNPVDINGTKIPSKDLMGKVIFTVDTEPASIDNDYYINMAAEGCEANGFDKLSSLLKAK